VANAAANAKTIVVTVESHLPGTWIRLRTLKAAGLKVHIETSGAYPLSGQWDWICLSPKKTKLPTDTVYDNAHELKGDYTQQA
jgi:organic radical activating enzyme